MKKQTIRGIRGGVFFDNQYTFYKTLWERFGRQAGSKGGRAHHQESMAQLHKLTKILLFLLHLNTMNNNYPSAREGLHSAIPNHAKIRRGMVSWWIDGRLMFSIWRKNQDVTNQWEVNGQMK